MKTYDPAKVEALLMEIGDTHDEDLPPEIVEAAAAVRSSAREVEEPSEEEIERFALWHEPGEPAEMEPDPVGGWVRYSDHRAALSRFSAPRVGGVRGAQICKTHGLAVLVCHVNNGEPCGDYLDAQGEESER